MPHTAPAPARRRASCSCGTLSLEAAGQPDAVYLCGCSSCRRSTGGPFAWRARYSKAAVTILGKPAHWRRIGDAGRWVDHAFCAKCGTTLFQRAEAAPDAVVVSAGCFDQTDALEPSRLFRGEDQVTWCTINLADPPAR